MRCAKLVALVALGAYLLAGCGQGRDIDAQVHLEGQGDGTAAVPGPAATGFLTATALANPDVALTSGAPPTPAAEDAATAQNATAAVPATDTPLSAPTEAPLVQDTETAIPVQVQVEPVAIDQFTFDPDTWDQHLATLSSFRQKAVLDFVADDSGVHSKVTYEGDVTMAPDAIHSLVRVEGQGAAALPANQVEAIWIGDQVWIKLGRRPWVTVSVSAIESEYGGEVVGVGELLPFVRQARRVLPDQTVNGIPCQHYVYDLANLAADAGMTAAQGDIWVAQDGGYVVRLTLNGHGTYSGTYSSSGTLELVYDLYDVNLPMTISPPG